MPTRAEAADETVSPCNEGSLRDAIDDAPDGGTVDFGCDGVISLENLGSAGPIFIGKELTLDGSGRRVIIDGLNRGQIFFLSTGTVTMRTLTVQGGSVTDPGDIPGGGAVRVAGTRFVADRMRFLGNYSENQGGAISATGAPAGIVVTDSEFVGNSVGCGTVCTDRGGGGGAIAFAGGQPSRIERTSFRDNSMVGRGSGGAVMAQFTFNPILTGPLTIADSEFERNTANNFDEGGRPPRGGGAVAAHNHPLTIERSTFVDNHAIPVGGISSRGGAVNVGGDDSTGVPQSATISDSTFTGNVVHGGAAWGGAIYTGDVPTEVAGVTVTGNEAEAGGGVAAFGPLSLTDSLLGSNTARGGFNGTGGGIWAGGTTTVAGTDVLDNVPDGCFERPPGEIVDGGGNTESAGANCGFPPFVAPTPPAPPTPPAIPGDVTAPAVSKLVPRPFKLPEGKKLSLIWRQSEPAAATLRFQRLLPGRRVDGECVAPKLSNLDERRCRRVKGAGELERPGEAGENAISIRRIGGELPAVGLYRVTLIARDGAGNPSEPRSARFKVVPEPGEPSG